MKHRSMDLLKYRPFPELAEALRRTAPMVIERWQEAVRQTLPAAHELTLGQVRNSLPETLESMAAALEAEEPKATKDLMDQAVTHGETRFDQSFALGELMIEYGLLRPILIEEIAADLARVVSIEELQALNLAADIILRRSVTTYVNQQKEEMHALVEAQSKYLSFLSHDLRGNLNGVLLMIEVLRRELGGEARFAESIGDLDVMRRSILETVTTMDRFLHAERFRKGKVQVRPSPVQLKTLVTELVSQLTCHAKEKGLTLTSDAEFDAQVISDRDLLVMILQNLIGNAVKYAQRGEVKVMVGPCRADRDGCRVSVIDHGPGIADEQMRRLFQPYARGETHGQQGNGLGLSIARQAADLLGAKLWAESKVGDGTAFHLDLPPAPPKSKDEG